jgi:glutaredoxin
MSEQKKVILFTQPGWTPCFAIKAILEARGVEFTEKDVSADQAAVFELLRKYKSRITPTLVIGDEVLTGFDPKRIDKLLTE